MKKIFAVIVISMFSLNCMAESYHISEIFIHNKSPKPLDVRDSAGHTVAVSPERDGKLYITVPILLGETLLRVPTSSSPLTSITIRDNENWSTIVTVDAKNNDNIHITITDNFEVLIS